MVFSALTRKSSREKEQENSPKQGKERQGRDRELWHTTVTMSFTDQKKISVNYFGNARIITRKYSKRIHLKIFGPITENTLPFTDPMTLGPNFREKSPAMNYRMKIPNN